MRKSDPALGIGSDDVQRVGACMIGAVAPASLAHKAVLGMEMDLLRKGWPVGQSLGALPDVQKQLGLGRPASREAITILEARGLLDVRRGPGGGLFVAAPSLEDVAGAVLMYLALTGVSHACIEEFRLIVWRMIVTAATRQRVSPRPCRVPSDEWGFASDLAERIGNTTMVQLARLAEILARISHGNKALTTDSVLEAAIGQGDLVGALERIDIMAGPLTEHAPVVAIEVPERGFSLSGRKSAMALATRLARELIERPNVQEAEWETADRLGYTDAVVRQARRILQDFGIATCQQGRKGADLAPPAAPTGVIRLLAACFVAGNSAAQETVEPIALLISCAPALAAQRVKSGDQPVDNCFAFPSAPHSIEALTQENRLLDLSGNPLLAIIVRSLGFANVFTESGAQIPPHLSDVIAINKRIFLAVKAGDIDAADVLARAKLQVMLDPATSFLEVA